MLPGSLGISDSCWRVCVYEDETALPSADAFFTPPLVTENLTGNRGVLW